MEQLGAAVGGGKGGGGWPDHRVSTPALSSRCRSPRRPARALNASVLERSRGARSADLSLPEIKPWSTPVGASRRRHPRRARWAACDERVACLITTTLGPGKYEEAGQRARLSSAHAPREPGGRRPRGCCCQAPGASGGFWRRLEGGAAPACLLQGQEAGLHAWRRTWHAAAGGSRRWAIGAPLAAPAPRATLQPLAP
jgi:hypothetical protein